MKIKFILLIILALLSSCQLIENYKDNEAIKLVQARKFGTMNAYAMNMYNVLRSGANYANLPIISPDATNLEAANVLANEFANDHFEWKAKYAYDAIFLVSFYNDDKKLGFIWEADVDNQIVKCVTFNPELLKKYNLSTDTVTSIKPRKKYHKRPN